jgi:hypothetical protein
MAKNSGFQVVLVKRKLATPREDFCPDTYDVFVLVNNVPMGLFKELSIEFDQGSGLPILNMKRVLYGEDTISIMSQEEADARFQVGP